MTNVIGLFNDSADERFATWRTMREIHESLKVMKSENDNGKFDIAIDKETSIYYDLMDEYLVRKAA